MLFTATEDFDPDNLKKLNFDDYVGKTPIDEITVSLLTTRGEVGYGSGLNWGFRRDETKRNKNQSYIPYNRADRKPGFFPDQVDPESKHCPLFKVITKESGAFYMRLAQGGAKGDFKGIHSAESNTIIGKWLRNKLGLDDGEFITLEILKEYGSTRVVFRKYENNIYTLHFDPQTDE